MNSWTGLHSTVLLCCTVLYCTDGLGCTVLYLVVLYCTVVCKVKFSERMSGVKMGSPPGFLCLTDYFFFFFIYNKNI